MENKNSGLWFLIVLLVIVVVLKLINRTEWNFLAIIGGFLVALFRHLLVSKFKNK